MASHKTCDVCRWWKCEQWAQEGTCVRIHAGGGQRDTARIYPVTSGAYLETPSWFGCSEFEKEKS